MAILSQSRTSVFIFLLTLSSGMSQSNADEIQSLLRYLGAGWGAGYHSYGTASTARTAHGFRCNDRYSRPANFGCIDCGGYQRGQGFAGNDGHYQGGYPQGYVSPTTDGRSRNHLGPTYTPRDDPHAPQDDLQPALPPLQPVTPDQEAIPKTNGRSTLPSAESSGEFWLFAKSFWCHVSTASELQIGSGSDCTVADGKPTPVPKCLATSAA